MAAQVLSGSGNVSYTNSTGQNVRLVINYLKNSSPTYSITVSFQGVSFVLPSYYTIGKSIPLDRTQGNAIGQPTEIALSNGATFSAIHDDRSEYIEGYNIIIIPEAG